MLFHIPKVGGFNAESLFLIALMPSLKRTDSLNARRVDRAQAVKRALVWSPWRLSGLRVCSWRASIGLQPHLTTQTSFAERAVVRGRKKDQLRMACLTRSLTSSITLGHR